MPRVHEVATISLLPGGYFIGGRSCRMRTVLGAGIVITLWRRAQWTGAMAYFRIAQRAVEPLLELDGRGGEEGLQAVLNGLQPNQSGPEDCEARICGSGNVLVKTDRVPAFNSGQSSGELARRLLRACRIPIISESFYAVGQHEITFDVQTGRVRARTIKSAPVAAQLYDVAESHQEQDSWPGKRVTLLR